MLTKLRENPRGIIHVYKTIRTRKHLGRPEFRYFDKDKKLFIVTVLKESCVN